MNQAYLLMGGNLGNRLKNLVQALHLTTKYCGPVAAISAVYETAAWGKLDQPDFLNLAIRVDTALDARSLMTAILQMEENMGRKRNQKWTARIIDIDILLFNNDIYNSEFIHIPHPELPNRKFALIPLAEIAGNYVHPFLHKTIDQLLQECSDRLEVRLYDQVNS